MNFRKLGRIICAVALGGTVLCMPLISGCNTAHPEAQVVIRYYTDDTEYTEYTLKYKMYRNMYPQTVQHFIELTEQGFYNETIIHSYSSSSYWYGGGYDYIEGYSAAYEDGDEEIADYLENACKYKEYYDLADPDKGIITTTVYGDISEGKYINGYRSLIGEFTNNNHKIKNGALSGSYGCLSMSYVSVNVNEAEDKHVYLDKTGTDFGFMGDYKYNCATSYFRIQTSSSTSSSSSNCIFATLKNTDVLEDLQEAISDNGGISTTTVKMFVTDELVGPDVVSDTYYVPETAIVIQSVKITKY